MRTTNQTSIFSLLVLLSSVRLASAYNAPMCADIEKGNVAACKAAVAKQCTDGDSWGRKVCEGKVAPTFEQCGGPEYEAAAKRAAEILKDATPTEFSMQDMSGNAEDEARFAAWLGRVTRIAADVAEYPRLHEAWKMCSDGKFRDLDYVFDAEKLATVRGGSDALKTSYASAIDYEIKDAKEQMARQGEDHDGPNELDDFHKRKVEGALAISARLPAPMRHREADLRALLATSAANGKAMEGAMAAQIAATSCPKGPKLGAPYLGVVKREFDTDKGVKRREFRQTPARRTDREGLISRESVPVRICTEHAPADGKARSCGVTHVTVFREKPPGGAWTSWQLAVGGGEEFNCAKW